MQLEWARVVAENTGRPVLILTPLAVSTQTEREGTKFGIPVSVVRDQGDVVGGINVTNYERLHLFDTEAFGGVVLDESSILKSFMGKTKRVLVDSFERTRFRLACTATPAPNDHMELGNHSEFLGVMRSTEMLSRWFVNDSMNVGNYRVKHHAEDDYWRWVASWAVSVSMPSDLRGKNGRPYPDDGFVLPELRVHEELVGVDHSLSEEGELFRQEISGAINLHREMRLTAPSRARRVLELVDDSEPWVIWCNTNYEADALTSLFPDAVEVRGSDSSDSKIANSTGAVNVIITKPTIAGFGLNWQHCAKMAFVGLSYSYEQLYQALRRSYRFGQKRPVDAYVVVAETEGQVLKSIREKQTAHRELQKKMAAAMREVTLIDSEGLHMSVGPGEEGVASGEGWELFLGDCVDVTRSHIVEDSVGFSVFSPPFSNLYIYTDSLRDMGNTADDKEFFTHFSFMVRELYRVTIPGRLCAVHCKDLPLYKGRDGASGLRDFPGAVVRAFEQEGWIFHSRVTIWKCPVTEMQRTKNHGLLYKELCKDSSVSRQGMADFLLVFRKWDGEFSDPVTRGGERFDHYLGTNPPGLDESRGRETGELEHRAYSINVWQRYASPVWFDIQQPNVLNYRIGKTDKDEKHICPLQLDVIERAVELWSNPGDLVFSPFAGIGSEGYVSLRMDRKFLGIELKRSYWEVAAENLRDVGTRQIDLFNVV
jgi:hypothetical protein